MLNIYITLGYLIDLIISTYYGMSLFSYKKDNVKKNTVMVIVTRILIQLLVLPLSKHFVIKIPILCFANFLIYDYFYDAKRVPKLVAITLYFAFGLVGEFLNSMLLIFVFHMNYMEVMDIPLYTIFSVLLVYTVIAILCELTILFVNKKIKNVELRMEYFIIAVAIFTFICGFNLYSIVLYIYKYNNFPFLALAIFTFAGNIIAFFFLYKHLTLQKEKESERIFINRQMVLQRQHYEDMQQKYMDIRKLQHDFKNHLQTIEALNSIHEDNKMSSYITELSDTLKNTDNVTFCNNAAIDSVLYNKVQYAEKHHIDIQINSVPLSDISVSDMDLCSIIYNLLDNAIERCEKEHDNRYIIFNIHKKGSYLVIECRNSCTEYKPQTSKSNKDMHGWGMKIIKSIAEKYNGNDYYDFKNNEFIHIVNISCCNSF